MGALMDCARDRSYRYMVGDVLADNEKMLRLMASRDAASRAEVRAQALQAYPLRRFYDLQEAMLLAPRAYEALQANQQLSRSK